MLYYMTNFESVQALVILGVGIVAVVAMVLRSVKQAAQQKSNDMRFQAAHQIELAYASQLKLAQETHNERPKAKDYDQ